MSKKSFITLFAYVALALGSNAQFFDCSAYFYYSVGGNQVHFTPMAGDTLGTTTFNWDFGDGATSTEIYPVHIYDVPGSYMVCLTVEDLETDCFENFCMTIETCFQNAIIDYWQVDDNTWHFENSGYEGENQNWYLWPGDAQYSGDSFEHNFVMSGSYTIGQTMTTGEYYTQYSVDWQGNITTTEVQCGASLTQTIDVDITNGSALSGTVFSDTNMDGILDENETTLPWTYVYLLADGQTYSLSADANGYYEAEVAAGTYTLICTNTLWGGYVTTLPITEVEYSGAMFQGYEITVGENESAPGLNFGLFNSNITVSGQVFADENGNGMMDEGEQGVPYATIPGSSFWGGWTDMDGNYFMSLPIDDYEITTEYSGNYTVPVGGIYSIIDPSPAQAFTGFDFGLDISATDIACNISWVTPHVPGFYRWVNVEAINNGVSQSGVELMLELDDDVEFEYASGNGVYDSGTHTVAWTLDLGVLEIEYPYVEVYVPLEVEVGENIVYSAIISSSETDEVPTNNVSYHQSLVVSSYDPNMIVVSPQGQTTAGNIPANLNMQYTIHFQNSGNYYATNVILKNELPSQLDLSTIEVMASSHPCTAALDGSELRFTFSNIMLPWEAQDEAGSQGWVTYRIDQQADLAIGTEIENTAAIYFDFNDPIITNSTLNTISNIISVFEPEQNVQFVVAPNPADELAIVSWNSGIENADFELLNTVGEKVLEGKSIGRRIEIERGDLASGYYQLRLISVEMQMATTPIVFR